MRIFLSKSGASDVKTGVTIEMLSAVFSTLRHVVEWGDVGPLASGSQGSVWRSSSKMLTHFGAVSVFW